MEEKQRCSSFIGERKDEIRKEICDTISSNHLSLNKLCSLNPDWPTRQTILLWVANDEDFRKMYNDARIAQTEAMMQENLDTAQTEPENQLKYYWARMKIDENRWQAERIHRKKWGNKESIELTTGQDDELELVKKLVRDKKQIEDQ